MKKFLNLFLLSLAIVVSCEKPEPTPEPVKGEITLDIVSIVLSVEGGSEQVPFSATLDWTASSDKDWLVVEPRSGQAGQATVTMKTDANPENNPRTATVTLTSGEAVKTIDVTQKHKDAPVEEVPQGNVYGKVTCNGTGVADVLVSDGVEIVRTDAEGNYAIQSDKKWRYVFVINPSGYDFPVEGILPANYKLLSQDTETKEQVDFELVQAANDDYTLLVLGDMHLANRPESYIPKYLNQFAKAASDIKNAIASAPGKIYVLTLGDMTWDEYWVSTNYGFREYLQTMNTYFAGAGVPFFHTMGNHDNEKEVGGDFNKALKYTQNLAPNYYSFNIGSIHYISMDSIDCTDVPEGSSGYRESFTEEQLEWLEKDLSYVDKSTPVFVYSHANLSNPSHGGLNADMQKFVEMFEGYNVKYLSGHTHNMFHKAYNSTFEEYNGGSICGSWWWSEHFTPGVHLAQDGTPGGFTVWTVNGTERSHFYKSIGKEAGYQFRAYDMNKVKEVITEDYCPGYASYTTFHENIQAYAENTILVNVWGYGEGWTVEITEDGSPLNVEAVTAYDPLHIAALTVPGLKSYKDKNADPNYVTTDWTHFFKAVASAADTPVTVTVTDVYGNSYSETMARPKTFVVGDHKDEGSVVLSAESVLAMATSSTLVFAWTEGGTAAKDIANAYTATLYKDAACTVVDQSFDIPAGCGAWNGAKPKFVFGGLQPATDYWFKVKDTSNNVESGVVKATTKEFTVVMMPSSITEPGVVLAEDFGEIRWDYDRVSGAMGFFPKDYTDFACVEVDAEENNSNANYMIYDGYHASGKSGEWAVLEVNEAVTGSRLDGWLFEGPTYVHPGYLRLSNSSTEGWIYTPEVTVPEGKKAVVTVSITAGRHDGNQESKWAVIVLTPSSSDPETHEGSSEFPDTSDGTVYQEITFDNNNTWKTNSVSGLVVRAGERILFGPRSGASSKKSRLQVSDLTVTVTEILDE